MRQYIVDAMMGLEGRGHLLGDALVQEIASRHGKTPAQVILRWVLQNEVLPLVKSIHAERIRENFGIFDFTLTDSEMALIAGMPGSRFGGDPDKVSF